MKNTIIIGILLFTLNACTHFLEEYSQELAKVETITDLDELLLGNAYLPVAKITTSSKYSVNLNSTRYITFINFMSDELRQNSVTDDGAYSGAFNEMFGYFTWQRNVGMNPKGTSVGAENAYWKSTYQYINVSNMIIDELNNVSITGENEAADKIRIEGEVHFLRALYYFNLVNLYAAPYKPSEAKETTGIPLKLTSYIEDKDYTCSSVEEVYQQILKDLKKAEECLEKSIPKSIYRADITAVYLLTSRVYLYMQDYKNARIYAQHVLDRNNALTDLNNFEGNESVFTSESPEVIFSMGGHMLYSYLNGNESGISQTPYFISDDLLAAFDSPEDLRKTFYIDGSENEYYYRKIVWGVSHWGQACSVSDNFLFRVSEAYLNLAEASAFEGYENEARHALATLQAKRFRNAPTINESGNALIDLIRRERQRELCLEGHRWFDLRRHAACEQYPSSKTYRHAYTEFELRIGDIIPVRTRTYELEVNDKAYTLAFPHEVLDFQNDLNKNNRPEREPVETIIY